MTNPDKTPDPHKTKPRRPVPGRRGQAPTAPETFGAFSYEAFLWVAIMSGRWRT